MKNGRYLCFVIITLILSVICGILHYIRRRVFLSDPAFVLFYTPSSYLLLFVFSAVEKYLCNRMNYSNRLYAVMLGVSYLGTSILLQFIMRF